MAFAGYLAARLLLGPTSGWLFDAAGFTLCCGPASCWPPFKGFVAPLQQTGSRRCWEPCYRGPWRLRGPDSHRLAAVSLSLGFALQDHLLSASELLDAQIPSH